MLNTTIERPTAATNRSTSDKPVVRWSGWKDSDYGSSGPDYEDKVIRNMEAREMDMMDRF